MECSPTLSIELQSVFSRPSFPAAAPHQARVLNPCSAGSSTQRGTKDTTVLNNWAEDFLTEKR